jgi:cyanate permease
LPTAFLGGRAAAGGIALINALGNLGAVIGPIIIGWLFDAMGSFMPGMAAMSLTLVLAAGLVLPLGPLPSIVKPTERAARRW